MTDSKIFEPYNLNGKALNNRIVMAPMTRSRSANAENVATELTATYYEQRATSGLMITEGTFISEEAVGVINVPGIYTQAQVAGWKLVTQADRRAATHDLGRYQKNVGVRMNPSLHGIMGIMVDQETIATYDYIVNRLNDYDLAYIHLMEPLTDVSENKDAIQEVAKHFRKIFKGTLIINRGFTKDTANEVLINGDADLVSFGVPFIANPDLVERFKIDAPLNTPNQGTFYTPTEKGYADYPALAE